MATINAIGSNQPIQVAFGGTGIQAAGAAYAPICAGTTTTGAFQTASTNISNSGYVLTSTGASSLPTWQAAPAQALVLLSTQTASSSASLDFDNTLITSTYSAYFIEISGLIGSATSTLTLKLSANNGSTFISTGITSGFNSNAYNSATLANTSSTTVINIASLSTTDGMSGFMYAFAWALSVNSAWTGQFFYPTTFFQVFGRTTGGIVNYLQFISDSGNLESGTISLYGIKQ